MEQSPDLRRQLLEAVAWWLRTRPITRTAHGIVRNGVLHADEAYAADNTDEAVHRVLQTRAEYLRADGWRLEDCRPSDTATADAGRLLLLLTRVNLMDGAAALATGGFFGDYNFAPCDLWVSHMRVSVRLGGFREEQDQLVLVNWIPRELVRVAQIGVDANPERCLVWADECAPDLARSSRRLEAGAIHD